LGAEHGKRDSFSVNVEKKNFQCFACKARGSLLDFVAKFKGATLREAGEMIVSIMGSVPSAPITERIEKKKEGRPYGQGKRTKILKPAIPCPGSHHSNRPVDAFGEG
jgi:DNA primase